MPELSAEMAYQIKLKCQKSGNYRINLPNQLEIEVGTWFEPD